MTECRSRSRCSKCQSSSHHSLLHFVKPPAVSRVGSIPAPRPAAPAATLTCHAEEKSTVLLATAEARIQDSLGNFQSIRLVVDPGSQVSCISSSAAQKLGLIFFSTRTQISGIGNEHTLRSKGSVLCKLRPSTAVEPEISTTAIVLPKISSDLPSVDLPATVRQQY